ncbi:hypothetical protein ACSCB1_21135 [Streptomyces europaeiscabiei]|uniref:Uncharacterized protein n=1 Tax=Streptomyces europaeiscabiei TaxID=146819 RepID=A0ABU4NF16_9ACTN|nr:hypothetical protein [Streptomyces europaeiscabiei]MDX2526760.1 hypothetical protein [Streptomyces europaeiscabiei]MDX2764739.1 hypothetical protein [Streptomyces europaeiscabiei]MDX2770596.1 hypothetical protein [Streptomyces europaeiscabiei]MDX3541475.1 hypothetical protein [Streptomyces europaeiscabiei]MDX3551816.1 hypothetical protein [Streptomyces europaeiscabiei]
MVVVTAGSRAARGDEGGWAQRHPGSGAGEDASDVNPIKQYQ